MIWKNQNGCLKYDKHNDTVNILNEIDLFWLFYQNQNLTNKFKV